MDELTKDKFCQLYYEEMLSFGAIAKLYGTYSKKIQRLAKKWGCEPRDKSDAQKVALEAGRSEHPTEGKELSLETRVKISDTQVANWEGLSEEEKERQKKLATEHLKRMTPEQKKKMRENVKKGIRKSSQEGSKLEKFLTEALTKMGYLVEYHRKNLIPTQKKLEIDLFVPSLSLAIEIDGPAHWLPIFGAAALAKNQVADTRKDGLLQHYGYSVLRLRCKSDIESLNDMKKLVDGIQRGIEIMSKDNKKYLALEV